MYRGRAAAALLALAACVACSSAAPTASDHTALDLHEGPTEGCYYNFQHYGEGDRIMTNEPCLNCTCHNRMLMCYLRVCPFTKAIGQDCTVEKRADQCCPIVTCPDVPVDLLTSTSTSSPAEYGPTGMGKLDKYGCSINGKYFPEGSKVPPSPNKPCEHCYCIRNMTTCVMQECTLHVDGCTPIYHKDVCCPVRYSCDHTEDEIPLLDDMTTTVRPTPGFLLTTTTMTAVPQMTQDCVHDEQLFPDGASIKTDKACEHCYCMKGDIVCVVQECGTPMENEGKNCTSLPPRQGQCCPDTYICEGDEPSLDITTDATDLTSAPPRRVGVEGSGYRNEPDEPFTERGPFENEVEGSGDTSETDSPSKVSPDPSDELLLSTTEKDKLSQPTEEDKGFNTIPDTVFDKEPLVTIAQDSYQSTESTSTEVKATVADEFVPSQDITSKHEEDISTTEASFHPQVKDEILPTDISKQEEISATTPEFTTPKDKYFDNTVTETTFAKKETEQVPMSTESVTLNDGVTTESSAHPVTDKDISEDDISSVSKIEAGIDMTTIVISSVTEQNEPNVELSTLKEVNTIEDITTIGNIQELPETTSINPVDNEVDYIPARIPGEGDCLLNGITYGNNSMVPSTNNCHSGCKCISSIIKCDPIICSPPPEYMENMNDCQTSYDTPDACCPTYICNGKETSLPQSHSQTSVTESSKPIDTIECNGNDCSLGEEKQPPQVICKSGDCDSGSKHSDCGINGCQDQPPPLETPGGCSGEKCSVSPIVSCEGGNCESSAPEDNNVDKNIPSMSSNKPICTDSNGCDDTSKEEDCNEESCRRKETSANESKVPVECSGAECKISDDQNVPTIEQMSTPSTDKIFNENIDETSVEHATQNIIPSEKTPISESSAELSTELPTTKVESLDTESSSAKIIEEKTTELPDKLETYSETNMPVDIDSHKEMDIPKEESDKSEKLPEELIPTPEDSATEYTKTSNEESSTENVIYDQSTGMEEIEAVTESRLADNTVENKDIHQDYTTEAVQINTEQSGNQSEIYETKQEESFTKLPIVMDDEKEKHVTEILNEIELKVTTESQYHQPTAEEQEKIHILPQLTTIQETMTTEIPERLLPVSDEDVDKITIGEQAVTTEQIEDNKTERSTSPEVYTTQHPMPVKTEEKPIETITSDSSTSYDKDHTVNHDIYTQSPHPTVTESDKNVDSDSSLATSLKESDDKVKEFSTPSSVTKENEKLATNVDAILPEDDSQTDYPKYATSTESEPLQHVDKNDEFGEEVTENQITETEQETYTQVSQEATEKTKLDISTESNKESDMQPIVDKELQTSTPFDVKEPTTNLVKDVPATESSLYDASDSQTEIGEQISESKTTTQDISILKETSMTSDEGDNESAVTDKSIIRPTSPSSVKLPSIADTQDSDVTQSEVLTTELPKEIVEEGYPIKDIDTQTTQETYEEEPKSPENIPEKSVERDGEAVVKITTSSSSSSESPNLSSQSDGLLDDTGDKEKVTSISISDVNKEGSMTTVSSIDHHEPQKSEDSLQESTPTSFTEIEVSERVTEKISTQPEEYATEQPKDSEGSEKPSMEPNDKETNLDVTKKEYTTESPYSPTASVSFNEYSTISLGEHEVDKSEDMPESNTIRDEESITTLNPIVDEEAKITDKIPTTNIAEENLSTEKSKYDTLQDGNVQPSTVLSTEAQTVTEDKELENKDQPTSISVMDLSQSKVTNVIDNQYEKTTEIPITTHKIEMQDVQEEEKISTEEPKQSTNEQFDKEVTTQDVYSPIPSIPKEHSQTELPVEIIPTSDESYISPSKSDAEIESNVVTTESVPVKQEDLPIHSNIPLKETHSVSDESQTMATQLVTEEILMTSVGPIEQDTLLTHSDGDMRDGEENTNIVTKSPEIMDIDSDKYPITESLLTNKPLSITTMEVSLGDVTKASDGIEEQPYTSRVPELVDEQSTSISDNEMVTKLDVPESFVTKEGQYITESVQEETSKIPEYVVDHGISQSDIESITKQVYIEPSTTERQYVTKSDQDEVHKHPEIIEEQSTSRIDTEDVEKVSEPATTEKQLVTMSDQEEIHKYTGIIEEQSTSHIDTENVEKVSEPATTEKQFVTKSDQEEIHKYPGIIEEQSTSHIDTEDVEKVSEPATTEKQFVTKSDQEEIPKYPGIIEEQSTSRINTEDVEKVSEPATTEKQFVTMSDQEENHKYPEIIEEQSTSRTDAEDVEKVSEPATTEKQFVTKSDQRDIHKYPEIIEEQSTSRIDTEDVEKVSEPASTEKQFVTKSDQEDIHKYPEIIEEQSTSRIDTEDVEKVSEPATTEKQFVTKSDQEDIHEIPEIVEEQNTSAIDVELVTKQEISESYTTEKQYVSKSDQEETQKIPVYVDEQSTPQNDIENVTKFDESERTTTEKQYLSEKDQTVSKVMEEQTTFRNELVTKAEDSDLLTTEKQYVTQSDKEEEPSLSNESEKEKTQIDSEIVTKPDDNKLDSVTTETTYEDKFDQEDVSKSPEIIDEQGNTHLDTDSVTKLEDNEAITTEKQQYMTQSDIEKTPDAIEEHSTSEIDTENVNKVDGDGVSTTEKPLVTEANIKETSSDKVETDAANPDKDIEDSAITTSLPIITVQGSDLNKPLEDVTDASQTEDLSTKIISTDISVSSVSDKIEDTTKSVISDTVNEDNVINYSTERNVESSTLLNEETQTANEPENKTPVKQISEEESAYSETTPYSVLLQEHTHSNLDDTSSDSPIEEAPTTITNKKQPERGDHIPDIYDSKDDYGHSTEKQIEQEVITMSYEKESSPDVQAVTIADFVQSSTIVEKAGDDHDEDKKYASSIQDEKITTPIVVATIQEEEHTTVPSILDKEFTTLRDIISSTERSEFIPSSSQDEVTQDVSSSSTSKLHEETTHSPIAEDQEKPFSPSPIPSSSETTTTVNESPDISPSGPGGYGSEPDYVEEDQSFGPGTCRYGGKVYVSAQQIPRDDPCDFCFCFRSDIICLQQSCPPPIHGCHEEPIQGFCCPRYECPVSMATTVNVTTTTTTTTTTLPPHFFPHAYKGAAQRRGCQIKGHSYKVGEVVRASSGPCLHCTCGGDGQMKCDPKACTPEPMLRQMIAAAVSAKRRR